MRVASSRGDQPFNRYGSREDPPFGAVAIRSFDEQERSEGSFCATPMTCSRGQLGGVG